MLLDNQIEIVINSRNTRHLELLGYDLNQYSIKNINGVIRIPRGTRITIKTLDLQDKSSIKVRVLCDYCNENIVEKHYNQYLSSREIIPKDCCDNTACINSKREEVVLSKYNVTNINKLEDVKLKIRNTNLDRYGVEYGLQNEEVKEKGKKTLISKYNVDNISKDKETQLKKVNTFIERFGETNPQKNKEVQEKTRKTNLKRYNVEYPMQNKEVLNKSRNTNISKYGVSHLMKIPEIQKKRTEKMLRTMYSKNILIGTSSQQIFLHNLLGGELNYPINNLRLDIAFPDELIYIEYNGSGHRLRVKFGEISDHDFDIKEINRGYFLSSLGWKRIQIVSTTQNDYLPQDNIIIKMIQEAKEYLNSGHSWIEYNIDEENIKCSQYEKRYDFELLRRIKQNDIKEMSS